MTNEFSTDTPTDAQPSLDTPNVDAFRRENPDAPEWAAYLVYGVQKNAANIDAILRVLDADSVQELPAERAAGDQEPTEAPALSDDVRYVQ